MRGEGEGEGTERSYLAAECCSEEGEPFLLPYLPGIDGGIDLRADLEAEGEAIPWSRAAATWASKSRNVCVF